MARLFLDPGSTYGFIGGFSVTDVVGTNDNETVLVEANGRANFDPSFNRGGDEIQIDALAVAFSASLSGSALTLTSITGADLKIPVGTNGLTLTFTDGSFDLLYNGTNVVIGEQVMSHRPEPVDSVAAAVASAPPIASAADVVDTSAYITLG
ncbi:MAG: hypothetical protein KDE21_04595 [Novosphingobium sp.]|nr:hypothetical protein [Novosphingobium sp.]